LAWPAVPDLEAGVIYAAARDVTERHRAQERLRLAVESFHTPIVMVDANSLIVLGDDQTERLLGYARGELVRENVDMLVPAGLREDHAAQRSTFHSEPTARHMAPRRELCVVAKDGENIRVDISLSPVEIDGQLHVVASLLDLREQIEENTVADERVEAIVSTVQSL